MYIYKIITPIQENTSETSNNDKRYLFEPLIVEGIGINVKYGKEIEVLISSYVSQRLQVFDETSHYIPEVTLEPSDEELVDFLVTIPIYLNTNKEVVGWDISF